MLGKFPPSKASAKKILRDLEKSRMARGGSLLWWVTAVILHCMITGSPLTVYNCWRPRESWSTNKPRDKQQHADEEESTAGVKVLRAQSRLRRKPVQSATTCLTSVYFGSWSCSGAGDYSVTRRQASEERLRQSRPIICWEAAVRGVHHGLREHRGGASWRNIPANSAPVVVPPGWESEGICSMWRAARKVWEVLCRHCIYTGSNIWLWFCHLQCEMQRHKFNVG